MSIIKNYDYVVKNPDTTLDHRIKNIIAGFPGVGKSTAAKNKDWMFLDMESSYYHWIVDNDGNKVCHHDWPINYVDAIIKAAHDNMSPQLYILISTHNEVLAELDKRRIYYNAVLPKNKDIYLQRYRERGNTEEFIKKLDADFDTFIKSVESTNVFGIYYTDDYLFSIFVPNDERYPYSIIEDFAKADLYYRLRVENLPTKHTGKPIVAVIDQFMVKDYHCFDPTSFDKFLAYMIDKYGKNKDNYFIHQNIVDYIDFIELIANNCTIMQPVIYIHADPVVLNEMCKRKLNFILAVPETYIPNVHYGISSKYGDTKMMFDAYVNLLECYSFRTMVSDFYIDEVFRYAPAIDSACLIRMLNDITNITTTDICYDPDEVALPFKKIINEYLESVEEDKDNEEEE